MDLPSSLIIAFPPSADLLLDRTRRLVDDAMLMEVARADYGHMADEMLAELRPIRDNGVMAFPLGGKLAEVLSLTQFSNPEKPNAPPFEPGPTGRRGHQTRLFACAVLLRATAEAARGDDLDSDSALAIGLASAKVLGDEMSEAVGSFLTWRFTRAESPSDRVFNALALLIVATRFRSRLIPDPILGKIAEWVLAEEERYQREFAWNPLNPRPTAFSVQHGFWAPLAAELTSEAEMIPSDDIRTNLKLCALFLVTE